VTAATNYSVRTMRAAMHDETGAKKYHMLLNCQIENPNYQKPSFSSDGRSELQHVPFRFSEK
jgi:hypothetical protein